MSLFLIQVRPEALTPSLRIVANDFVFRVFPSVNFVRVKCFTAAHMRLQLFGFAFHNVVLANFRNINVHQQTNEKHNDDVKAHLQLLKRRQLIHFAPPHAGYDTHATSEL